MLGTVTPLGERARGQRWLVTVIAYIVGSVMAGAALGGALGLVGAVAAVSISPQIRLLALLVVATVGLLVDARLLPISIPSLRRQVNDIWLTRYRGWVYGLGFGLQLGAGVLTIVESSSVYAMLIACLMSVSAGWGSLIGAGFGLTRAAVILLVFRMNTPEQVFQINGVLRRLEHRSVVMARVVQGAAIAVSSLILLAPISGSPL